MSSNKIMQCVVLACNQGPSCASQDITYFPFPTETLLRTAWLKALNKEDWNPEAGDMICSNHFLQDDMSVGKNGERILHPAAVPVITTAPVCRICFSIEGKLYQLTEYRILYDAYETLTGLSLKDEGNLPQLLCTECACRLLDCVRFRSRSLRAHLNMLEIVKKYDQITVELIQTIIGIMSPIRSTKSTDWGDLEVELALKGTTKYTDNQPHYRCKGIDMSSIKVENDEIPSNDTGHGDSTVNVMTENNDDMACSPSVNEDTNVDCIKAEFFLSDAEDEICNDIIVIPKLRKETAVDNIKTKSDDINQEINHEGKTNDNVIYLHCSDEETIKACDKTRDNPDNMDTIRVESSSDSSDQEVVFTVEDYSSDDSVSSRERGSNTRLFDAKRASSKKKNSSGNGATTESYMLNCELCPFETKRYDYYTSHLKAHMADNLYSCKLCNYKTNYRSRLTEHIKIHNNDKPYACHICPKRFLRQNLLNAHLTVHSGDKPYSCNICNQKFTIIDNLIKHNFMYSAKTHYTCLICNRTFYQKTMFEEHSMLHSGGKPFVCKVCNKAFRKRANLITHSRIHSGEKPFSCKFCEKKFTFSSTLRNHLFTHTREKPYSCNICKKTFQRNSILQTHMKVHSADKPHSSK